MQTPEMTDTEYQRRFRNAYSNGFRSCLAALRRSQSAGVPIDDALDAVGQYTSDLIRWAEHPECFGKPPRMYLWDGYIIRYDHHP